MYFHYYNFNLFIRLCFYLSITTCVCFLYVSVNNQLNYSGMFLWPIFISFLCSFLLFSFKLRTRKNNSQLFLELIFFEKIIKSYGHVRNMTPFCADERGFTLTCEHGELFVEGGTKEQLMLEVIVKDYLNPLVKG